MTVRVLLADDQSLIRAGFRAIVDSDPVLEVVGEAGTGAEAVRLASSERADIVLMDIRMPVLDGIAATEAITSNEDLAGVRIIILTTFELDEYVIAAIRAGASGFLDKGVEPQVLLDAIHTVADGDALLTPRATRSLLASIESDPADAPVADAAVERLTDREREITALVGQGLSNDEIAAQLFVSPLTAKTHVNRAMMKLGARDRAQLVVFALRTGLTRLRDLPPPGS